MPRTICCLLVLICLSCASTRPDPLNQERAIPDTLQALGHLRESHRSTEDAAHVVVIKDRHSARPGFHRVRPQLRAIHQEHRRLVEYLSRRGFAILGCEQPLGPLLENKSAAREFRIIRRRLRPTEELDEYGVFQAARYALMWPERLEVHGVEDPELYEADRSGWETYVKAMAVARRKDRDERLRLENHRLAQAALRKMDANVRPRGMAAAANLLELMKERGMNSGILLIGGAHVPGSVEALRNAEVNFDVFESRHYSGPFEGFGLDEDDL